MTPIPKSIPKAAGPQKDDAMRLSQIALIVLVAAIFGCLMATRDIVDSIWARSLIAGIAGGSLALGVSWALRRKAKE
jgi:hypothetical protein